MAHTMVLAPYNGKLVFCIVIHAEGLLRIEAHAPAVVRGTTVVQALRGRDLPLSGVDFMVCYEPELDAFEEKCRELDFDGATIMRWLARNWKDLPGDTGEPIPIGSPKGPFNT